MNTEGQPESNAEKERAKNIALQFLATLESIEKQSRIVDMEASSGDKIHVPTLERDESGDFKLKWYGKNAGPTDISNTQVLKARLKTVESIKELLDDELKAEIESGILRAGIYLSSAQ